MRTRRAFVRCKEHSNRMDQTARVESGPVETTYRAVWQLKSPPLVSLIVPTRDNREVLEPCPSSLLTLTDYPRFEVIVVDNGSSDGETLSYLESIGTDSRVTVLRHDVPYNFSAINIKKNIAHIMSQQFPAERSRSLGP